MCTEKFEKEIEDIDKQIVRLLERRMELILEAQNDKKISLYHPEKEQIHLEELLRFHNSAERGRKQCITSDSLIAVFREIFSATRSMVRPLKIAFLGPEASFTHLAAIGKFGHEVEYIPKNSISDIFEAVETKRMDFGCVPVENSTEGAVNHTLDRFIDSTLQICAEINMRIHHNLMAKCEFSEIKKIYTHAQVLGQCRHWLQENLHGVEYIEVGSTTKAAEIAAKEDNTAAIASTLAAEIYELNILREHIEDAVENITRFLVIGNYMPEKSGNDKTSIAFAIKDRVGALYDCLLPFKENNITLTMIESRPSKTKNWHYCFFVDLIGHICDEKIKASVAELEHSCQWVKILGSYPRTVETF